MAIKHAMYKIAGDVYHFNSDDTSIKVLDNEKHELGTLRSLMFEGKVVEDVDFKTIKHTGVYKVKGLHGLPENIPADRYSILMVNSIGDQSAPEITFYHLITSTGVVSDCTVSGDNSSSWGSGGVEITNAIKRFNASIGTVAQLETTQKNLVGSINEVLGKTNENAQSLADLTSKFKNHNHDERYLSINGGTVNGSLTVSNGNGHNLRSTKYASVNGVSIDSHDVVSVGDTGFKTELHGKGSLYYNGERVLTSASGGVDAGTIGGHGLGDFIMAYGSQSKWGDLTMVDAGVNLRFFREDSNPSYWQSPVISWRNSGNRKVASIESNIHGDIALRPGGNLISPADAVFGGNHEFTYSGRRMNFVGDNIDVRWQTADQSRRNGGIGFYMPAAGSHSLMVGNWDIHDVLMEIGVHNGEAIKINHSPYIGEHGSRLFIQNEQPSGDVPYGSVWIGF